MAKERMIELLAFERKCVELAGECDRNCAECNLVQDTNELLEMYNAVIDLIRQQEAIKPVWDNSKSIGFFLCGKCGANMGTNPKYCWYCGRKVKYNAR